MTKGPAKSDSLLSGSMEATRWIAPYSAFRLTRLLIPSGMVPLSWFSCKPLRSKAQLSQLLFFRESQSSLQLSQIDQVADNFWNGPAQLVLMQSSMINGPTKSDSLLSGSNLVDVIAPYNSVRLTRLLIPSGMGPLSWFSCKPLCSKAKPSQTLC